MAGASRGRPSICPVIVGPTAAGKTGLVTALASEFPIEIVSLDSRQVYHGLRIGTAQPTAAEQTACRHHLIDFLAPEESYSAQRFRRDFVDAWEEITARGKLPVLAGGAGMYLRAVSEGFFQLPAGSEDQLPAIREEVAALDNDALARELSAVDPASHHRLHANDRYRRTRALEVFRLSGRPLSELMAEQEPDPALGLAFPLFVLEMPVAELDHRIARRTEQMLAAGWLEEVHDLLDRHEADCFGMRSIGYAEIVRHLQGILAERDLAPAIVQVTRQYAKRQRTWFRPLARVAAGRPDDTRLRAPLADSITKALDV